MVSIIKVQESRVVNLNTQTRLIRKMHLSTEIIVFGTINLQIKPNAILQYMNQVSTDSISQH